MKDLFNGITCFNGTACLNGVKPRALVELPTLMKLASLVEPPAFRVQLGTVYVLLLLGIPKVVSGLRLRHSGRGRVRTGSSRGFGPSLVFRTGGYVCPNFG